MLSILHGRVVHRQFGVHPLEPGVSGGQILEPLKVRGVHTAVLPLIVCRRADPGLPAQALDRDTGVALPRIEVPGPR